MRVVFFTDSYLPNVDGVVASICTTRRELERRGHEVYIFSPGTRKQKDENKDPRVYYFTSTAFKPYPDYRLALINFFSPIKLVKDLEIHIVHSHGIATTGLAAIQSAKKLNIPAVATFHTLAPEAMHYLVSQQQLKSVLQGVAWRYLQWYYSNFEKVLVPSAWAKKILAQHGIKNTVVQPSGIETAVFRNADGEVARKIFKLGKRPTVLYLGRVALEKNLEMLINAAPSVLNILPKTLFVIAGKGPAERHYKELVAAKGLEQCFLFTGYVENEMLPHLYAAADVFVFPSLFDTQGIVVLEAMASGTPAVVQKNSAAAEFITDGVNGYTFSDGFDLHEKIVVAIKNKHAMRQHLLETAMRFDIRNVIDSLLDIYKSVGARV